MDFDLNDEQLALEQSMHTLAARRGGAGRLRSLLEVNEYDGELHDELANGGFFDLVDVDGGGPLAALVVVESMAAALANVAVATHALILPSLGLGHLQGPVALVDRAHPGPVRFAAHARNAVVLDGDRAGVVELDSVDVVETPYSYPLGRVMPDSDAWSPLDCGADEIRGWWRVALAAEVAAVLGAGTLLTRDYVCERHQFGRALGSFQAVQHHLARSIVHVESVRWMARWAAGTGCAPADADAAAVAACVAAVEVPKALHQVTGAMGFTLEHDLHLYTGRAVSLRVEMGGIDAHARALTAARWG